MITSSKYECVTFVYIFSISNQMVYAYEIIKYIFLSNREHRLDRRRRTKERNIISEEKTIKRDGGGRTSGGRDRMSGRGRSRAKNSRKGFDIDRVQVRTKNGTLEDTSDRGEGAGRVI